jgi:peptide/nickel transport system permease protein
MPLILRRFLQLAVVFVVVTFFTVALISLVPGSPEVVVIPFDDAEETQRTAFREDNNLDEPLVTRWFLWAQDFLTGDMGNYYTSTGTSPVSDRITAALPVSLLLILYVQIVSLGIAIPLAVWAAYRSGTRLDKLLNAGAFGCISLPGFAVALIITYSLGVNADLIPTEGYTRISEDLGEHFRSMVAPVLALSLGQVAVYMRLLRSDLVATLQEDFILMAKAKGISNSRVLWRHALRPSSLTLLTVAGLSTGNLIGGALVVEAMLRIPGMGSVIGEAILKRQYVALQSSVALIAIGFVLLNFLIDYLYTVLDPRIRERSA